jgi:hypothetical protein
LCVVAAPYIALDENLFLMSMVTGDDDRRSWWVLNRSCLLSMLRAAGFADAAIVSTITLEAKSLGITVPHIIAHAHGRGFVP